MAEPVHHVSDEHAPDGQSPDGHSPDEHTAHTPVQGVPGASREVDTTLSFNEEYQAQLAALQGGATSDEDEAVAALPSGSALLVVRRGPNIGARFLLDSDVTVAGRHPDAGIFLDDVTVSRKHAEFRRSGTTFTVNDLGSLNGTYFDGVRIDEALLSDGAEVQVGKFRLTFYASRVDLATLALQ